MCNILELLDFALVPAYYFLLDNVDSLFDNTNFVIVQLDESSIKVVSFHDLVACSNYFRHAPDWLFISLNHNHIVIAKQLPVSNKATQNRKFRTARCAYCEKHFLTLTSLRRHLRNCSATSNAAAHRRSTSSSRNNLLSKHTNPQSTIRRTISIH